MLADMLILLGLGLLGWLLLARLRMPASEVLGPAIFIGALRILQVDLPYSPGFIFPLVQIVIGIFVGSMLTKQAIRELKPMTISALVIITWALSTIFLVGFFLARYTALDLYTAMLSASMGGLPEITIIALASGASITVIVVTQMLRLIGTIFIFPLILKWIEKRRADNFDPNRASESRQAENQACEKTETGPGEKTRPLKEMGQLLRQPFNRSALNSRRQAFRLSWKRILFTLAAAAAGGLLLETLGVPAGLLVGATLFVAAASIAGIEISKVSPRLLDLLLVFIGINIADNISIETIKTLGNSDLLLPILIATAFIFATSFGISGIIKQITGWDYPTCFLAAAPGGFTMMTALAIKHGLDPLKVSMLHLCRLLSINIALPFIFMLLMSR